MNYETCILVVDDEEIGRCGIAEILMSYGYEVITAQDGQEALYVLKEKRFNLVITDLVMPGMTGIELLKTVKIATPETGVIIVTGYGNVESYLESMNFGAFEYLNKPIKVSELKKIITRFFDHPVV